MNPSSPFFSIVIPTRNESEDILKTLISIRENSYTDYEVLIVDASEDHTPNIVQNFGDPRFHLLKQDNRDGRCGARNQGIRIAKGEVVVILNADVRLPNDFLERIKIHYDNGADYVIVDSAVENKQHPFGAMVEAEHHYLYKSGRETVNWCEGYSCRRRCALEVGLFPEGFVVPICAGEDAVFGERMAQRFRRKEDFQLIVKHSVPEDLSIFWSQRIGRGEGCSQRQLLLEKRSFTRAFLDGLRWSLKSVLWISLFFPMLRYTSRLKFYVPQMKFYRLIQPIFLSRLGHEIGRWKGLFLLLRFHSQKTPTE